jgi:hypothetical protein
MYAEGGHAHLRRYLLDFTLQGDEGIEDGSGATGESVGVFELSIMLGDSPARGLLADLDGRRLASGGLGLGLTLGRDGAELFELGLSSRRWRWRHPIDVIADLVDREAIIRVGTVAREGV